MRPLLALQESIQETDALITKLERVLSPDSPRSAWANLRSLESRREKLQRDFFMLAERNALDVCRYRMFNPGERYKLSGFSKALTEFQNACALTFDALKNGPKLRAMITADVEAATSFDFAYAFTGSVGVVLTIPNERLLLGGTYLDEAMQTVFALARAKTSAEVAEFAKKIGPPPIRAMYRWASAHVSGQMGADIDWLKGGDVAAALLVQEPELERLRAAIDATSDTKVEPYEYRGEVTMWDVTGKRFKLQIVGGEEIFGPAVDEVFEGGSVEVPSMRTVLVERRTKIHYSTEREERTWKLVRLVD